MNSMQADFNGSSPGESAVNNGYHLQTRGHNKDINYQSFNILGKRARQENGLVELTKKFIQLLREAPDQCIDLNDTVGKLAV
jgi:hypothetical protein